jgi:hypothetical protein
VLINKKITTNNNVTTAFEGDSYVLNEIQELINKYKIKTFIETGTNTANTTTVAASMFENVHTIELNDEFYINCKDKLSKFSNVTIHNGSSEQILNKILPNIKDKIMFFLDAHWNTYCPILDELEAIYQNNKSDSVIVIHDFLSPNTQLGYMRVPLNDSVDGGPPLDYEYIKDKLSKIYKDKYMYYYNKESDGYPPTGVIFIVPSEQNENT